MQEAPTPPTCEVVILTALGLEYKAVSEHLQDMKEITHQGTVWILPLFLINKDIVDHLLLS